MAKLDPDRRRLLVRLMRVLGSVAVLEAGWIAVSSFTPGTRGKNSPQNAGLVVAGPVDRFAPGSVTPFADGRFYLARDEDGGFLALHRKCTHLGCIVPWNKDEERFACPCHASAFDIHGDVVNPPASRPLDLFAVTIDDGIVFIDTTKVMRRSAFKPDQIVRA